jgi:serine protease AprX
MNTLRYEEEDLSVLRAKSYLEHVDVYHPYFKIHRELWEESASPSTISMMSLASEGVAESTSADAPPSTNIDVIIQLHKDASRATLQKSGLLPSTDKDQGASPAGLVFTTIDRNRLADLAALDSVRAVSSNYAETGDGTIASALINLPVYTPHGVGLGLTETKCQGHNQIIHVVDSGFDKGLINDQSPTNTVHPAFAGRVVALYNAKVPGNDPNALKDIDLGSHGTHVAGCALGKGPTNNMGGVTTTEPGLVCGSAPAANLVLTRLTAPTGESFNGPFKDLMDRPYLTNGARIVNYSYGLPVKQGDRQYEYDLKNVDVDQYMLDHPDLLLCQSAGNNGALTVPAQQIGGRSASKNVLTVGNSLSARQMNPGPGYPQPIGNWPFNPTYKEADTYQVNDTSSRGPTVDGRIKPDVCAPGAVILSTLSGSWPATTPRPAGYGVSNDPNYFFSGGTSMASPRVAGCAAVLREALSLRGVNTPSAALLKALLINGAMDILGSSVPDPHRLQGFGRVNMGSTMRSVLAGTDKTSPSPGKTDGFIDAPTAGMPALKKDEVAQFDLVVPEPKETFPGSGPYLSTLKMTLTWMDKPGKSLVQKLGLSVTSETDSNEKPRQRRHGNNGDTNMTANQNVYRDDINNVVQIVWKDIPGGKYYVMIKCVRTLDPADEVRYGLAWTLE